MNDDLCSACGAPYDTGHDVCWWCEEDDDLAPCVCGYRTDAA